MDSNNGAPAQFEAPPFPVDAGDWRSQLRMESRQRIINKIMETLKIHLPFSGKEGLQELKQIAIRFEEKIYNSATSQADYLRKISLKMLTMESKSQNSLPTVYPNASPSNNAGMSGNQQDLDSVFVITSALSSSSLESQVEPGVQDSSISICSPSNATSDTLNATADTCSSMPRN